MSQIIISNGQVSIQFIQYVAGETDMIISRGKFVESFVLTSKEAEDKCKRHLADKDDPFKVVSINGVPVKDGKVIKTEPKAAAPKEPAPKKTREESLTEKYGSKEDRKAYIEAKKAFRKFYLSKGMKYGKAFDAAVKNALDIWEAKGRPAYSC